MEPRFSNGSYALLRIGAKLSLDISDVVAVKDSSGLMLKRIKDIKEDNFHIVGDNLNDSFDSRDFGLIKRQDVIGKVIWS